MKKKLSRPAEFRLRTLISALEKVLLSLHLSDLPGRVREVPDERTARYYTTIGLLSPPVRLDGRRALYGKRHLLELIAIKRLQSQNRPLRDILSDLRGAGMAKLIAIAGVDPSILYEALDGARDDRSTDLWPRAASGVAGTPAPGAVSSTVSPPSRAPGSAPAAPASSASPGAVRTFRVRSGMYLTIDPNVHPFSADELRRSLIHFADNLPPAAGDNSIQSGGVS